jgi:hypothetical protein
MVNYLGAREAGYTLLQACYLEVSGIFFSSRPGDVDIYLDVGSLRLKGARMERGGILGI